MAHLIQQMAYVGQTPWHALGHQLPPKQPIEVWAREAGMNWSICESPVQFTTQQTDGDDAVRAFEEQKVLFRSDTRAALSVVSARYQVVQPQEVLEFYRDLTEISGYELETAGVLKAGRKLWALARTGDEATLKGSDVVKGYLLLATSCDGTLATTVTPTTVRVVCDNTLSIALNGTSSAIRVPHSTSFDAKAVKAQLGIAVSHWDGFMHRMKALSERRVSTKDAKSYLSRVICGPQVVPPGAKRGSEAASLIVNARALKKVHALYEGAGRGAELAAAKGSAWGLLNAVTEFVDHERRARSQEYRLDSAWFGQGAVLKQRALDQALELIA